MEFELKVKFPEIAMYFPLVVYSKVIQIQSTTLGQLFIMFSLHFVANSTFLAAIITCTLLKDRAQAVSRSTPLVDPVIKEERF